MGAKAGPSRRKKERQCQGLGKLGAWVGTAGHLGPTVPRCVAGLRSARAAASCDKTHDSCAKRQGGAGRGDGRQTFPGLATSPAHTQSPGPDSAPLSICIKGSHHPHTECPSFNYS